MMVSGNIAPPNAGAPGPRRPLDAPRQHDRSPGLSRAEAATDLVSLSRGADTGVRPGGDRLARTATMAATTAATTAAAAAVPGPAATTLRVLSLNTYFDCKAGVETIADLIASTQADLVGLQEVNQTTRRLAEKLGMHYLQQDKRTALLSRFPIEETSPHKYGVNVTLDNGQKVSFLNAHTTSFPNQPHQLCHLPAGGGPYIDTEKQAIWWAEKTRGREFSRIVSDADQLGQAAIAVGDFNEPSHLDWTQQTADLKRHPIKVEWPGSKKLEQAGFLDSYRVKNPDVLAKPGYTWTPTTSPDDPNDHHDRIDFVMYRGQALRLVDSQVVGESAENADLVVSPWPTDHRAVLATFEVAPPAA